MGKKLSIFINILIAILFVIILNLFEKFQNDTVHLISINIILLLNLIISIACLITIHIVFKKSHLEKSKKFKENIQNAVANSFLASSIISIIGAIIIYCLLKNILGIFNIKEGIINYTIFATKTWFVSSPFIGLELVILKYFSKLESHAKTVIIIALKFVVYCILAGILYIKFKTNCVVYAKPICDIIFLIYYTKVCFDLVFKSK
jgi:hypothetical protein